MPFGHFVNQFQFWVSIGESQNLEPRLVNFKRPTTIYPHDFDGAPAPFNSRQMLVSLVVNDFGSGDNQTGLNVFDVQIKKSAEVSVIGKSLMFWDITGSSSLFAK